MQLNTKRTIIFDIETDLIVEEKVTRLFVICLKDYATGSVRRYRYENHQMALAELSQADVLVGHNIQEFDIRALGSLVGFQLKPNQEVFDTLLMARLCWSDIKESDFRRFAKGQLPGNLIGKHSLEAWGYRLGVHKIRYEHGFDAWSQQMEDYCAQDVMVSEELYKRLLNSKLAPEAVRLEHEFAACIGEQVRRGFLFNSEAASVLYGQLSAECLKVTDKLQAIFPPTVLEMKSFYYMAGGLEYPTKKAAAMDGHKPKAITQGRHKTKTLPFNPGSRDEIAERLIAKYGWKPTEFTEKKKVKVDESVLEKLDYPEIPLLLEYLTLAKRMAQLADGKEGLIKAVQSDGRIHGQVITNGAVTGRCAHFKPNMAQVPKVGSDYGTEFRSLMIVPSGCVLVGADASGLELRCLAHYLAKYDGGAYAEILLNGDIHSHNQKAAGLKTRDQAKTFIYALLYGAGNEKLGSIAAPEAPKEEQEVIGAELRKKFFVAIPAFAYLQEAVRNAAEERGYLIGLDGRLLPIRSPHAALNTLLQSAGAVIMKQATVFAVREWRTQNLTEKLGGLVAHIHDEMQAEVPTAFGDMVGKAACAAIKAAGEYFKFRCPLAGEYRIGKNWAETH